MSDSWVRDRMQAGEFPRPGETAEQYVEAFVAYRMRKVAPAASEGGEGLNLEAERARLAKEQADRIGMENALQRKELASLPEMMKAVATVIEVSMARLLRVPAIVAKGNEALRTRIDTAVRDALEDLSSTRVVELAGGGFDGESEAEDPADD